jgi:hypothetical protein
LQQFQEFLSGRFLFQQAVQFLLILLRDPGLAGIIIKVYDLPQFLRIGQAVDQILSLIGL